VETPVKIPRGREQSRSLPAFPPSMVVIEQVPFPRRDAAGDHRTAGPGRSPHGGPDVAFLLPSRPA
jgi:hypothetical protein